MVSVILLTAHVFLPEFCTRLKAICFRCVAQPGHLLAESLFHDHLLRDQLLGFLSHLQIHFPLGQGSSSKGSQKGRSETKIKGSAEFSVKKIKAMLVYTLEPQNDDRKL